MDEGQKQNQPSWVFKPEAGGSDAPDEAEPITNANDLKPLDASAPGVDKDFALRWTASEYIARQKNAGWFVLMGFASLVVAAIVYIFTKDILSIIFIVILVIAVGVFAARQPKVRDYAIGVHGVLIGSKFYPYAMFKSFAVMHEDALGFISLMPTKRFMPQMAMYYAPSDEDKVVDTLGNFLPYEERDHDMIDRLSRKIRF